MRNRFKRISWVVSLAFLFLFLLEVSSIPTSIAGSSLPANEPLKISTAGLSIPGIFTIGGKAESGMDAISKLLAIVLIGATGIKIVERITATLWLLITLIPLPRK